MEPWQTTKDQDVWNHLCPEVGRITISREQMGVYMVDVNNKVLGHDAYAGKWVYDEPAGCGFCGGLPVELAAVVQIVKQRREKYTRGQRKDLD